MSLYAGDMNSRIMAGEKMEDVLKKPDAPKTDWIKLSNELIGGISSTPVLCKDGTTKNQLSSPTGRYSDACMNNGGRAENQPVSVKPTSETIKQQNLKVGDVLTAEDKFYEMFGIKYHNTHMFGVASRMKGRFYLAVVLVAGYFAYKKFKK
jgi:hypothetical protein